MMMNYDFIIDKLQSGIKDQIFSAADCSIWYKNYNFENTFCDRNQTISGSKNIFFDIASITKPILGITIIKLWLNGIFPIFKPLSYWFGNINKDLSSLMPIHLLTHTSCLKDYIPFYREFSPDYAGKYNDLVLSEILKQTLIKDIKESFIYSDLNYILLGNIVEKQTSRSIEQLIKQEIFDPLELNNIFYKPDKHKFPADKIFIPVGKSNWRNRQLTGEVNDDNCYFLGEICGHAGLFSDPDSILSVGKQIIHSIKGKSDFIKDRKLAVWMITKWIDSQYTPAGWDTPTQGISSSGKYFSTNSFGHLGYTGCSAWFDPQKEIGIVLLTNRTIFGEDKTKIKKFRIDFHNAIMERFLAG